MTHDTYAKQIAELERRYWALQRRTILYGLLAVLVAMLFSVWLVRYFALSNGTAVLIGLVNGAAFVQTAILIVRWLNPLRGKK